jgi:hypothetical protein
MKGTEADAFRNKYKPESENDKNGFNVPSTPTDNPGDKIKLNLSEDKKEITTGRFSYVRETYARTLCGLPAYLMTITGDRKSGIIPAHERKCVIITNRTHPGETTGSFLVEGLIYYLLCML